MRLVHGFVAALAVVLLSGCSSGQDGRSMHDDLDDLDAHVGEVRAEAQAHASAFAVAVDVQAVLEEETRHHQALEEHSDSMNGVMEHMGTCHDGQGDPPDTAPMHERMQEMLDECTEHMALMDSAGNMAGMAPEEARHQDAMEGMLDAMEAMTDSMMGGAGGYTCPGGMMGGGGMM